MERPGLGIVYSVPGIKLDPHTNLRCSTINDWAHGIESKLISLISCPEIRKVFTCDYRFIFRVG